MNKPSVAGVLEKIHDLQQALQKEGERFVASPATRPLAQQVNHLAKADTSNKEVEEAPEDIDMESILKDKFLGTEVDSSKVPEI